MNPISVEVHIKGSTGTPYVISVLRDAIRFRISCTCPAGEQGSHCKHRLALLSNDFSAVQNHDKEKLAGMIAAAVTGTPLEAALLELNAAELAAKVAADRAKVAKKIVARMMLQ